jgi:hypothetical protein
MKTKMKLMMLELMKMKKVVKMLRMKRMMMRGDRINKRQATQSLILIKRVMLVQSQEEPLED